MPTIVPGYYSFVENNWKTQHSRINYNLVSDMGHFIRPWSNGLKNILSSFSRNIFLSEIGPWKLTCGALWNKYNEVYWQNILRSLGGSRIFSRAGGGGGYQKNFKSFTIFFWFDHIDFPSCPTALKDRVWPKFLRRRQFFEKKKQVKKAFLGTFWKIWQKITFFGARFPQN